MENAEEIARFLYTRPEYTCEGLSISYKISSYFIGADFTFQDEEKKTTFLIPYPAILNLSRWVQIVAPEIQKFICEDRNPFIRKFLHTLRRVK